MSENRSSLHAVLGDALGNASTENGVDILQNNDSFMSDSGDGAREMPLFRFITEGLLLILVSVFGIVGNIIAIVILSKPSMKEKSFSSLLIGIYAV